MRRKAYAYATKSIRICEKYLVYEYSMLQNIRPDYLFSYWVFAWYVLYMTGLVTHNPKFAIIFALLENLFVLASMLYVRVIPKKIFYFILIILLMKVLPLWTVRTSVITMRDVYATIGLFLMYIGWIVWDEKSHELVRSYTQMLNNSIQTPAMLILDKLFK